MKLLLAIIAVLAALVIGYLLLGRSGTPVAATPPASGAALVEVVLPDTFSANAQIGKVAFDAKCATCHGANAAGQDGIAPPLIHKIYEPNHHGDEAFQRAAALGVRSHHWRFGDMAPVPDLTRGDVAMIVTYIREIQRVNGIF